ncbi:MAG: hydroxyacid dehydrogenase [Bacteroidetes bacterium]|nr:MAG: hydroxyacid dehydrogenase [Bacteroidota bacterium]
MPIRILPSPLPTKGYAAYSATSGLSPFNFERRAPGPRDVQIEIQYCGVCHSDLHFVRNEWGMSIYPLVPGHEIVGKVVETGEQVTKFRKGDIVGVGCFVNSCRTCDNCKEGLEQYCLNGAVATYNSYERDGKTITYGGYSNQIVVDHDFVLQVSNKLPLEKVAPLLCAGITTYSPLRKWGVTEGHKLGVVGLGGLGHMVVKFGVSFGAETTVFSRAQSKEADAKKLGAHHFINTSNEKDVKEAAGYFDFIVDTVSAKHDYNQYLEMLKTDGTLICVGAPPEVEPIGIFNLIMKRRRIAGSLVGGLPETQEMLDYCAEHGITSDIELIDINYINQAYERMLKSDVKYRFVIDMKTL